MKAKRGSDSKRGALFALLASILAAGFLIPYKAAAIASPRAAVVVAMLLFAAVFNTVTAGASASGRVRPSSVSWRAAVVLALFSVLGNVGVAGTLAVLKAAVASVFVQTQLLMIAVLGWVFLGERVGVRFVVGATLALGGFVIMSGPIGAQPPPLAGVLWALLGAASFAVMQVYTRAVITRIHPVVVNAMRLWMAAGALLLWPGNAQVVLALPTDTVLWCALAAFLGPFLSRLCLMEAVRTLSAARVALIVMVNPVFAAALGFAAFGSIPTALEVGGAALILAGIAVTIEVRGRRSKATR